MQSRLLTTLTSGWLLIVSATAPTAMGVEPQPNLVLIVADDLGYGDLGSYGQQLIATPNLDQMAADGMRFTQFYSGSTVCAPSRCVLMTGLHTGHCLIRGNGKDNLRPADVTLAEVLKAAGYQTGMAGKWGLGHEASTGLPTRQGFDMFFGYLDQHHAHNYYPTFLIRNGQRHPLRNVVPNEGRWGQGVASEANEYSHDLIMEEALQFVRDAQPDRPFFLYLPLTIPHANNEAGKDGMEVPDLGQYTDRDWPEPQKGHAAMISRMDADIGRLFALLDQRNLTDSTMVCFTSDNGPHREGGNDPDFADSNGPLTGIKRSLHEGGIRVPMIVRWPNHISRGSVCRWIGGFQDILPTFAELGHATEFIPAQLDGISFAKALRDESDQPDHKYLYWAFYEQGGARALRAGSWKIIQQPYNRPARLYRLDQDLAEQQDLAEHEPDVLAKLTQWMDNAYTPSERWRFPQPKQLNNRR